MLPTGLDEARSVARAAGRNQLPAVGGWQEGEPREWVVLSENRRAWMAWTCGYVPRHGIHDRHFCRFAIQPFLCPPQFPVLHFLNLLLLLARSTFVRLLEMLTHLAPVTILDVKIAELQCGISPVNGKKNTTDLRSATRSCRS